jgi:RNA polymerase sigma factor (sigma-70 family)
MPDPAIDIEALARGDEREWRELLDRHGRLIYLAASRVRHTRVDRDDVFQDTCVAAYRAVGSLRDPDRIGAWLYRIAYRSALHRARTGASVLLAGDLSIEPDQFADGTADIDDVVDRLRSSEAVREALKELDERCRNLLVALFLDETRPTYADLSERTGIPVGAIGPTRARCLKKMVPLLDEK